MQDRTFWLVGVFMVLLMAVTAALPAHLVNLLREAGLQETWVLALPARSVWAALSGVPLASGVVSGMFQLPLASTTAVPSTVLPLMRVTVAPASPAGT